MFRLAISLTAFGNPPPHFDVTSSQLYVPATVGVQVYEAARTVPADSARMIVKPATSFIVFFIIER